MKKNVFKIFAAVILVISLLCSCSDSRGALEIKEKKVSGNIKAVDGTVVYSYEVDYPKIKIPGNKDIAKTINLNIENEIAKISKPAFDYIKQYEDSRTRAARHIRNRSKKHSATMI